MLALNYFHLTAVGNIIIAVLLREWQMELDHIWSLNLCRPARLGWSISNRAKA